MWSLHGAVVGCRSGRATSANRDIAIIGLFSAGDSMEAVTAIARKHGLTYPIAIDRSGPDDFSGETFAAYGIRAIPQVAVIGRDGRLEFIGDLKEAIPLVEKLVGKSHE